MAETTELEKYKILTQACLDFCLVFPLFEIKNEEYDSESHFKQCKIEAEELFKQGNLKRLKQMAKDLIEPFKDNNEAGFNRYILEKTGIDLGIRGVDLSKEHQDKEIVLEILKGSRIQNQKDADIISGFALNPYNKIEEGLLKKLQSLYLIYNYTVLRNENGERYSEITRRNKTKRRRNTEFYTVSCKISPDNLKAVIMDDEHQKNRIGRTSISLNYAFGGGSLFYAEGINLGITIQWVNEGRLLIGLPANIKIIEKKMEYYYSGDIVTIEYITK